MIMMKINIMKKKKNVRKFIRKYSLKSDDEKNDEDNNIKQEIKENINNDINNKSLSKIKKYNFDNNPLRLLEKEKKEKK